MIANKTCAAAIPMWDAAAMHIAPCRARFYGVVTFNE
jgi:hypothetical protein